MTDSLNVKEMLTQDMTKGFVPDVHCPTSARRVKRWSRSRIPPSLVGSVAKGCGGQPLWACDLPTKVSF